MKILWKTSRPTEFQNGIKGRESKKEDANIPTKPLTKPRYFHSKKNAGMCHFDHIWLFKSKYYL